MAKHGKKYLEAAKLLDRTKAYHPREAIELAKKMAHTKFDETVELHLRMGVDPRDATQQVRGVALLPHGLGKKVRVLVFAQGEAARAAEAAGADSVGGDEMVKKITAHIKTHGKVTLAEVRDLFQTSRKYAQAFMEHLDEKKITRRVGDERVLY